MKKILLFVFLLCLLSACKEKIELNVNPTKSDLDFPDLAKTWDEGMPLGNAFVGAIVWQKDSTTLRMSLDRIDLWDLRPMFKPHDLDNAYAWIYEQVKKKDYQPVKDSLDVQYGRNPAPSKIPGAGLEFSLEKLGTPSNVHLYLRNALCQVNWNNGTTLKTFVHASKPIGWFVFENLSDTVLPQIVPPRYNRAADAEAKHAQSGQDLITLGYEQGEVKATPNQITYHQKGWDDFSYDVTVKWERKGATLCGVWSITSSLSGENAIAEADAALKRGVTEDYKTHMVFWDKHWAQSSVVIPDSLLQYQYDNEIYKLGSIARENSYPISLQSVWTADNGKLPPWKGDYHHDLNTQLSYWPCYTGNYLTEGLGYLNTLWDQRSVYKDFTKQFYNVEGLNVPGVATLKGHQMGGWLQYSFSPTVSAWLSQHFYLQWKYSADEVFLKERAYPFTKDVATFLENISYLNKDGFRQLPIGSSPEVFDNSLRAWFTDPTNYDLSLMDFAFLSASEMADSLGLKDEAAHWKDLRSQLPKYDTEADGCLTFAKNTPYEESHRHFSHAMAIHPLGTIDWSQGEESQRIIKATIKKLDEVGPDMWTGYSYSWLGNMKARAFDGEGAYEALYTFADLFCLQNTFHANGDQKKTGKHRLTYRPFTLEGNMAFAAGVQEMLIQSHTGIVYVFPAIPSKWKDVSFDKLRTYGAFLVSADMKDGKVSRLSVYPEHGGTLRIASPYGNDVTVTGNKGVFTIEKGIINMETEKGVQVEIKAKS